MNRAAPMSDVWTTFVPGRDDPAEYDRMALAALEYAQRLRLEGLELGKPESGAHRMATAFLACARALGVSDIDASMILTLYLLQRIQPFLAMNGAMRREASAGEVLAAALEALELAIDGTMRLSRNEMGGRFLVATEPIEHRVIRAVSKEIAERSSLDISALSAGVESGWDARYFHRSSVIETPWIGLSAAVRRDPARDSAWLRGYEMGRQLLDDLKDIEEDTTNGRFTLAPRLLLERTDHRAQALAAATAANADGDRDAARTLRQLVVASGVFGTCLDMALRWLRLFADTLMEERVADPSEILCLVQLKIAFAHRLRHEM